MALFLYFHKGNTDSTKLLWIIVVASHVHFKQTESKGGAGWWKDCWLEAEEIQSTCSSVQNKTQTLVCRSNQIRIQCNSRKYPYSSHGRFLFCTPPPLPLGNSSLASYFASKMLTFKTPPPPRNFQWPYRGWVWIFSGTAHWKESTLVRH